MKKEVLLNIKEYSELFSNNIDNMKKQYLEYVKIWHPDNPSGDNDVFIHIKTLYEEALKDFEKGTYKQKNYLEIITTTKTIKCKYLTFFIFDFGICYICKNHIIYLFNENTDKYFNNMIFALSNIKYHDTNIENIYKRFMPDIHEKFKTKNGLNCFVIKTKQTIFPLKYVLTLLKGNIPDKHVAWIITRLHSIECFLSSNNIVHNGLTIENIFIEPESHSVYLFGGWWYSGLTNEKMIGVNKKIYDVMPLDSKNSKLYKTSTDIESIKLLGRELLGQTNPRILIQNKKIPFPFISFLIEGATDSAIKEFEKWDEKLNSSYGERKFIPMKIDTKNIYK